MSLGTQANNRSIPNRWARSAINVSKITSTQSISAKPMGTISYQCLHGHKHLIDRCQTNGHNQQSMSPGTQSMPNQWARSAINVNTDTSTQLSMPSQWARFLTQLFRTKIQLLSRINQSGVSISKIRY